MYCKKMCTAVDLAATDSAAEGTYESTSMDAIDSEQGFKVKKLTLFLDLDTILPKYNLV